MNEFEYNYHGYKEHRFYCSKCSLEVSLDILLCDDKAEKYYCPECNNSIFIRKDKINL